MIYLGKTGKGRQYLSQGRTYLTKGRVRVGEGMSYWGIFPLIYAEGMSYLTEGRGVHAEGDTYEPEGMVRLPSGIVKLRLLSNYTLSYCPTASFIES